LERMQFELCKVSWIRNIVISFHFQTRLERVSDGCMEFLGPEEIECLICNMTYPLHKRFNMCRAIRHLKLKHPEQMPEHNASAIENLPPNELDQEEDDI
jgi:hypothetical protein